MQTYFDQHQRERPLADRLFGSGDLSELLSSRRNEMERLARNLPEEVISAGEEHACNEVFKRHGIDALHIYWGSPELMPLDDNGHADLRIRYRFTGSPELFGMRPSSFFMDLLFGKVIRDQFSQDPALIVPIKFPPGLTTEPERQRARLNLQDKIQRVLDLQSDEIAKWKALARPAIQALVRAKCDKRSQFLQTAKAMQIPLVTRPEALPAPSAPVPLQPKQSEIAGVATDWFISDEDYDRILSVIRAGGSLFERAAKTFAKLDEEALRDVLNAMLNTHYKDMTDGEAFRLGGKSDIQVKIRDKAAFIAECKIWGDKGDLHPAIDQIFLYTTWKDVKVSVIFFSKKTAKFKELQEKMPELIKAHSRFIRSVDTAPSTEWRAIFRHATDPDRQVTIHFFVFDVLDRKARP